MIINVLEDSPLQWTTSKEEGLKDALQDGALGIYPSELQLGSNTVNSISTDTSLSGSSDSVIPTENAVKSYVDANAAGGGAGVVTLNSQVYGAITTGFIKKFVISDGLSGLSISEVRASINGLPEGQDLKVDVRKNGQDVTDSIFTSDVPLSMSTTETVNNGVYQSGCNTTGSTVGSSGTTLDSNRVSLNADDVLFVYVTQVGSTVSGADLDFDIIIS